MAGLGDFFPGPGGSKGGKEVAKNVISTAVPEVGVAESVLGARGGNKEKSSFGEEYKKEYNKAFGEQESKTFFSRGGGGGGKGGGGGGAWGWLKLLIIIIVVILAIVVVAVWFISTGGLQASSGLGYQFTKGIQSIGELSVFRQISYWIQHPFEIGVTGGQYEELPPAQKPEGGVAQAFTIEVRGFSDRVLFDQSALSFYVKINNAGWQRISKMDLTVDSAQFPGCLNFDDMSINVQEYTINQTQCGHTSTNCQKLYFSVRDIPPHSTKEVSITGVKINPECVRGYYFLGTSGQFKAYVPIDIPVDISGFTYYTTSSRLAVQRIDTNYAALLIQNDMLRQERVGATYQAGTAMTIDLDIGDQPIFDNVNSAGLLMRWMNNGAGRIPKDKAPLLFIITPKEFSTCEIKNLKPQQCDEDLTNESYGLCKTNWTWNFGGINYEIPSIRSLVGNYSPTAEDVFNWTCDLVENKKAHVCASPTPEEFSLFACTLSLTKAEIPGGQRMRTDYITAVAIYPYEVSTEFTVKAYCTGNEAGNYCEKKSS